MNPLADPGISSVRIRACHGLKGDFRLPGDKSISHRAAMIASIGIGASRIYNYSTARDCQNTIECLTMLGVPFRRDDDGSFTVEGVGTDGFRQANACLDAGNSGSTLRMISGILAGLPYCTEIQGDESLARRPMRRIIDPLEAMGARIKARDENFPPLRIFGGNLHGIEYALPVASAQVKTCVLLAGLFAAGRTTVIERTPTRNHTELMLRECGVELITEKTPEQMRISLTGGQRLRPLREYTVAGDVSSAAFFLVAALITDLSDMALKHIGINTSRTAVIDVLRQMGGQVLTGNQRVVHGEQVADLGATSSRLEGEIELSGPIIANLIDEIPILSIAATQLHGTFTVRDAHELRVKESDRIRSIVDNLSRMGVDVEEYDDGFRIEGPQKLHGARVDSYGDHRIAMAFTVAGLIAEGETEIVGADAAAVSLPEFFDILSESGATVGRH